MLRSNASRDAWRPQTAEDRHAILRELQEVLGSAHFCNSRRYPALLQYVVENTLAGRSEQLKERTIGVEVFDRASSYDTGTDTVVRYTAGEVRKRLALYYHELDRKPLIRILLPPGSYVPEFLHAQEGPDNHVAAQGEGLRDHEVAVLAPPPLSFPRAEALTVRPAEAIVPTAASERGTSRRRYWGVAVACLLLLAVFGFAGWHRFGARPVSPVEEFWAPLLHDGHTVLVCSGGVVFKPTNFSGVETAGKDIAYPFISSQIASSIARISGLLGRDGATMDLQFSATTPLTLLREQPVVLLGGYNNQWTMRLIDPLPFHFIQWNGDGREVIVSASQPGTHWMRDPALPYASADDYALVARFRDTTTGSWVLVIAGLGRNGTEAAALFVTSPQYMSRLRDGIGGGFANRNVEAVLKVSVIDGKTGAPSILATHAW